MEKRIPVAIRQVSEMVVGNLFLHLVKRIQVMKMVFVGTNTNIFVNGDTEIIDYSDGYKVSSSYKFSNGAERICSFKDGLKMEAVYILIKIMKYATIKWVPLRMHC